MKTWTGRLLSLVIVVLVALAGCTQGTTNQDPAAASGTWVLESFGGTRELQPADPGVTTRLTLKDGTATGTGGVNTFTGTYQIAADGTLSFGQIASTAMAGSGEAMAQESAFFAALASTKHFEITDGKLVFSDNGNSTLVVLVRG